MPDAVEGLDATCSCGHVHEAHEHYRRGTDCALCPPGMCAKFTAQPAADAALQSDPIVRPPATGVPLA